LEEIKALDLTIHHLEKELGETPREGMDFVKLAADLRNPVISGGAARQPEIRPDEFVGQKQTDAAKSYLGKIGHAVSLDQIVEALRKGGANLGGADPKRTLYVSLARNPTKEFHFLDGGYIGLSKFYPGLSKSGNARSGKNRKHKKKPKARTVKKRSDTGTMKKQTPTAAAGKNSKEPSTPSNKSLGNLVLEFLKDGALRSSDSIHQAIEAKLGQAVKKISVIGTLNNRKQFEKVGKEYRLLK
jgi:hypothetical protein